MICFFVDLCVDDYGGDVEEWFLVMILVVFDI